MGTGGIRLVVVQIQLFPLLVVTLSIALHYLHSTLYFLDLKQFAGDIFFAIPQIMKGKEVLHSLPPKLNLHK
jgi:hypothetical protein